MGLKNPYVVVPLSLNGSEGGRDPKIAAFLYFPWVIIEENETPLRMIRGGVSEPWTVARFGSRSSCDGP